MQKILFVALILGFATPVFASTPPDDLPPPPDRFANLQCKYVYISFPNTVSCPEGPDELDSGLYNDVPYEFTRYMNDQANGYYTFEEMAAITRPQMDYGPPYYVWWADYEPSEYIDNYEDNDWYKDKAAETSYGVVNAEIVDKIIDYYDQHYDGLNPFDDCDYVFFVHNCNTFQNSAWKGICRTGLLSSYWVNKGLMKSTSGTSFRRDFDDEDIPEMVLTLSGHEFGHVLGFPHSDYGSGDPTITYGAYDMMRTPLIHTYPNDVWGGLFSYHAIHLIAAGWMDAVTVTEEENNIVLYDSQLQDNPFRRNAIVIPLADCGGLYADERFVLTFHQNTEYDHRHRSHGLQVWHVIYRTFSDIEAAGGRWSNLETVPYEDPINGVDKLDLAYWDWQDEEHWDDDDLHNFVYRKRGNYDDFFDVGDTGEAEFSYKTNPSTWGSGGLSRTDPQNVETTLYVRARQRDDYSIFVDVYPMPREEIISPTGGAQFDIDDPFNNVVNCDWDNFFEEDTVLDQVKIWFSRDGDNPDYYDLVETTSYTDSEYDWVPTGVHVTDNGWIKFEYTNTVTDRTSETVLGGTIIIDGTLVPWANLICPDGGESLYVDEVYEIRWTTENAAEIESVDIDVSTDSGTNWQELAWDAIYRTEEDINIYDWTPPVELIGENTKVRLTYNSSGGGTSEDISNANFSIYPIDMSFDDVSTGAAVDYAGTPYSAATLDYNSDNRPDMFVTIQACEGCEAGEEQSAIYKNLSGQYNSILFYDDVDEAFTPGSLPIIGSLGLAVADYDSDGDEDFFVTHTESPQLFNYDNGQFTDVISEAFGSVDPELLKDGYCANWVDTDHDGDLDLYLGRARTFLAPGALRGDSGSLSEKYDVVFENRLIDDEPSEAFDEDTDNEVAGLQLEGVTVTAAWAAIDDDNRWVVAVGGFAGAGEHTRLYIENAEGLYIIGPRLPDIVYNDRVVGLQWVDFDRDDDLDLLVVGSGLRSYVVLNSQGSFNDVIVLSGEGGWSGTSGVAQDFNLDGYPDILLGNRASTTEPRLLQNLIGHQNFSEQRFVDMAHKVGLVGDEGLTQGVLASDFNGDGDPDLLLGRESLSGRIFQNQQTDGTDDPANHWIAFELTAAGNSPAIGATVKLFDGSNPLGMQVVDGGSGRGTQQPQRLVFGTGDFDANATVYVRWPSTRVEDWPVSPNDFGTVKPLTETEEFEIDQSSVEFELEYDPTIDRFDWIFTWNTNYWTEAARDTVHIEHTHGSDCGFSVADLTVGVGGVTTDLRFEANPGGGDMYVHELRWSSLPCKIGCKYSYEVRSWLGDFTDDVGPPVTAPISFKVCPKSN